MSDDPPTDVMAWLRETYTDEGVEIWLRGWRKASPEDRERFNLLARTDPIGT